MNAQKPQIWPISLGHNCDQVGKATDRAQNRIMTGYGEDTYAYQISGHCFHVFSVKCPETSRRDGRQHDGRRPTRSPHPTSSVGTTTSLLNVYPLKIESTCFAACVCRTMVINATAFFLLTHWGREKMAAISQTTHSNACSWNKMFEFE